MNEVDRYKVTPQLESILATELRVILEGIPVGSDFTVAPSADFCYSLELFLPQLLRLRHPEWEKESLDGVFVATARKTGSAASRIVGTCILISDQTVTPFLLDLALSSSHDTIASFRVCLGTPGRGRLGISGPDCNSREAKQLLATISTRQNDIHWSYEIVCDENQRRDLVQ